MDTVKSPKESNVLKARKIFRGGLWGASVGAFLGLGMLMAANASEPSAAEKIRAAQAELSEKTDSARAAIEDETTLRLVLGKSCLDLLDRYVDGPLRESTDTVVADLLDAPGSPCGDSPTEARSAYVELGNARNRVNGANGSVDTANYRLDAAWEHDRPGADNNTVLLITGATVFAGALVGSLAAANSVPEREDEIALPVVQ